MSNWTPEEINELLAVSGVRTPGNPVAEPERVIAVKLLDARAEAAALREETRRVQGHVERAEQRADVLEGVVTERNELLVRIDQLQKALAEAERRALDAEAIKVTAFALVRELEVKLRGGSDE